MKKYFECTVSFEKPDDTGKVQKYSQSYLTEAETFGEAEDVVLTKVAEMLNVNPEVSGMRVVKFNSVLEPNDSSGLWYHVKVRWEDISEKGKTVTYKEDHLLPATSPVNALAKITEYIDQILVDYEITSVGKSKIRGVFLGEETSVE